MEYTPTGPIVFIAIVLGYLAISVFILGGKKVYFEPYDTTKADEPKGTTEH